MGDRLDTLDMGQKVEGCCAPFSGGAGSPYNTMRPGPRPTSVPSGILIHSTVQLQYTNVTVKHDRQDNVTVAYGEPLLVTVPPKTGLVETLFPVLFWKCRYCFACSSSYLFNPVGK